MWRCRNISCPLIFYFAGTVFGNKDLFHGLGLFIDTYPNDESADVSPR